jgi:hypothetical protein
VDLGDIDVFIRLVAHLGFAGAEDDDGAELGEIRAVGCVTHRTGRGLSCYGAHGFYKLLVRGSLERRAISCNGELGFERCIGDAEAIENLLHLCDNRLGLLARQSADIDG